VDNIKIDLREIGWGGMDWIELAQDAVQWRAVVNTVMNIRVPKNAGKFLSNCTTGVVLRRARLRELSQSVSQSVSQLVPKLIWMC
jgi:hypothetical protein